MWSLSRYRYSALALLVLTLGVLSVPKAGAVGLHEAGDWRLHLAASHAFGAGDPGEYTALRFGFGHHVARTIAIHVEATVATFDAEAFDETPGGAGTMYGIGAILRWTFQQGQREQKTGTGEPPGIGGVRMPRPTQRKRSSRSRIEGGLRSQTRDELDDRIDARSAVVNLGVTGLDPRHERVVAVGHPRESDRRGQVVARDLITRAECIPLPGEPDPAIRVRGLFRARVKFDVRHRAGCRPAFTETAPGTGHHFVDIADSSPGHFVELVRYVAFL